MTELPVLTLALPPNMANKPPHWSLKARYMNGHRKIVGANFLIHNWLDEVESVHEKLVLPLDKPDLHWTVYTHQIMDENNCRARLKWPEDALVHNGVIKDDAPQYIGKQTVVNEIYRKNPRVELRVSF